MSVRAPSSTTWTCAKSGVPGNRSGIGSYVLGAILFAPSLAFAAQYVFSATDDAYVDSKWPSRNYGSEVTLELRDHARQDIDSYIKFSVAGVAGTPVSARLRLFVDRGGDAGGSLFRVADTYPGSASPWGENQLTWANAPALTGPVIGAAGTVNSGTWVEFDVTAVIAGNGVYSFALSGGGNAPLGYVSDEGGANRPQLVVLDSVNTPPVVSITAPADGSTVEAGNALTFAGSASDGEDGDLAAGLSWTSSIDGSIGIGGSFTHSTLSVGVHTVTASVTDSGGLGDSDSIVLTVEAANTAPTVAITTPTDGATFDEGESVSFAGTADDAEDGDLGAALSWTSSLDGAIGGGGSFSTSSLSAGIHTITASVTDSGGLGDSDSIVLTVEAANTAPTVAITTPTDGATFDEGESVSFAGTADDAEDGDLGAALSWTSSLDGAIGGGGSFSTSSLSAGVHTVTASVTDSGGLGGSDSITLTVESVNTAPTATITAPADGATYDQGDPIDFAGTASDAEDGDLGDGLAWTSSLDGAIGVGTAFSTSSLSAGVHGITAGIVDSGGLGDSDQITLIVQDANASPVVTITAPTDGASFDEGTAIDFAGTAEDSEDGDLAAELSWTSSLDGAIGSGAGFTTALSPGSHVITADVTDSAGAAGSDSVTVQIDPIGGTLSLDVQVLGSANDAEEVSSGTMNLTSSDLEMGLDGGNTLVGVRFEGIDLERGSVIAEAWLQFTVDEATTGATQLLIQGQAADDAMVFTTSNGNLSSRLRTTAGATWSVPPWPTVGASGADQRSVDLAPVISEIVNRPGWIPGNALVLLLSGSGVRVAESYNGVPGSAAALHIDYAPPGGNIPPSVDVGPDQVLTLPADSVVLDASASDDGEPQPLVTLWTYEGGTGAGSVSFDDPFAVDTTARFDPEPGTYVLRLTADDGEHSTFDELVVNVVTTPGGGLSLDVQVVGGANDAEEVASGSMNLTSSDLEMGLNGGNTLVGVRFEDIALEPGSVIAEAWLQFTVDEATTGATQLLIEGQASDHATVFTTANGNLSSRPRTTASATWSIPPWPTVGAAGPDQRSIDLAPIISEIVNRPGWSSGNALVLMLSGSGVRVAESYNGVPGSAAALHIGYDPPGGNLPPIVDAGPDQVLSLPGDTVVLDASASDDGEPQPLVTLWTHEGGTGAGSVSFDDPFAVDTTASFDPEPGTYVLRLTADDGEHSTSDEMVVSVHQGGEILSITQINHFDTGFVNNQPLAIPAIDPAGLVYHEPSDRLFIADSEINEVSAAFEVVQANLFATPPTGGVTLGQWDTTQRTGNEPLLNREPTGITYCGDGHFYVTNDDAKLVYRYAFDGTAFTAVDAVSTVGVAGDPEGITCDPAANRLYVIGGVEQTIIVYRYDSGFILEAVIDLTSTAGDPQGIPSDAEGIAYDPGSGHLFVLSSNEDAIFEYDTLGLYFKRFDISGFSPRPIAVQGLSIGPSSMDPAQQSFYIADGMFDNDFDPSERDGRIYEALIIRAADPPAR